MNFDANLIAPSLGVLGLLIVVFIYQWIKKQPGGSGDVQKIGEQIHICLLYTSPSPRDVEESRMPSSA